ncbi:hypothetical protein BJ741DRAFT_587503 [Chytriomyces cf. hyalinus JEL632]|nr:hypothetical protein BJ741DRAFT_587503 [Chytriomyces cf. hyalinus JEL632]
MQLVGLAPEHQLVNGVSCGWLWFRRACRAMGSVLVRSPPLPSPTRTRHRKHARYQSRLNKGTLLQMEARCDFRMLEVLSHSTVSQRFFNDPPPHAWIPFSAPEKEPVDFSEDDLYIIEVSDDDEQEDEVMSVDKKDETEASAVNAVEPQNEQADVDASAAPINYDDANDGTMMETDGVQGGGEDEEPQDFSGLKMALGGLPGAGGRSGPLKLNTLATRFLNDQRHEHHDTPPNSAI